ncbi:hypothetical protein KC887_08865 [Candidatus Kaiserbacteria bacterium]|nr:hypothetical protein [Candidatus Kaiserbacteria bacterium]
MSESVPIYKASVKKRPLCSNVSPQQCWDCLHHLTVAVLFDGEHIYDVRAISPQELAKFNEIAQKETDGTMWWEFRYCELEPSCV